MAGTAFPGIFPNCVNVRLERSPRLLEFVRTCQRRIDPTDGSAFWRCEDDFVDLARSGFLTEVINADLARTAREPAFIPDAATDDTLAIASTDRFNLVLRVVPPDGTSTSPDKGAPRLASLPEHAMLWSLGPSDLSLRRFEVPEPYDNTVFDRTARLIETSASRMAPGTLQKLRAGRDLYLASNPEEPLFLLVFTSQPVLPLIWHYDPATCLPTYGVAANPRSSRLEFAAVLLAELGDARDAAVLENLLDYPDHFVRWSALKALMALDEDRGMEALERAVTDVHPHVSRAAKRSLAKIRATFGAAAVRASAASDPTP